MKNSPSGTVRRSLQLLSGVGLLAACASQPTPPVPPVSPDPTQPSTTPAAPTPARSPEERADALLAQMTLEEKLDYIGGHQEFFIRAVPRLGIPEIKLSDGPAGCRNWGPSTAYPASLALAASFDLELAERVGTSMGRDCRARGVHILLAPGVNIHRSPLTGRNFEYLGEDPLLAGKTASAFIRGVQGQGVLATVKHFVANNQEWDRNHISSELDERTLREIYLPAFERSVREAGVATVMTAYNLLNGTYCSHHSWLLNDLLKGEWGFRGFVMSDWKAVHDTLGATTGGCDLEMPSGEYMNRTTLLPLLTEKRVDVSVIDDKVRRILRTLIGAGFFDRPQQRDDIPADDPSSVETAVVAAERSMVLLKNDQATLPLDATRLQRIAVIGPTAHPAVVGGSGSAYVTPIHTVSLLDGLKSRLSGVEVLHHQGVVQPSDAAQLGEPCFKGPVKQEIFASKDFSGTPLATSSVDRVNLSLDRKPPAPGIQTEHYAIRWTGVLPVAKAGRYELVTNNDDGMRVYVDQKLVIDDWKDHAPTLNTASLDLKAGDHPVVIEYYQGILGAVAQFGFRPALRAKRPFLGADEVTALARQADVVVVGVGFGQSASTNSMRAAFHGFWPQPWARQEGLVEAEDSDRPFELPAAQYETIRAALKGNPRTVVVVTAGGAVDLEPFVGKVPALLWAWYPGQEGGRALADILLGRVNPSGRLPVTFAKRYADYPSSPYYHLKQDMKTPYTEGVFVGYRGFDAKNVEPAFGFGHGLSYTTFAYSDLSTAVSEDGQVTAKLKVTNTGPRAGDEVVQIYVAPPASELPRPPKELKGYARVSLGPGESREVAVALAPRAFAYWDVRSRSWKVDAGRYEIVVGASARDVRLRETVGLAGASLPATAPQP